MGPNFDAAARASLPLAEPESRMTARTAKRLDQDYAHEEHAKGSQLRNKGSFVGE
jgi:hypothetical protein